MILCLWHFSLEARLWHTKELKCHFHVTDYKPEVQRWPLLGTQPQVEKLDDSQREDSGFWTVTQPFAGLSRWGRGRVLLRG